MPGLVERLRKAKSIHRYEYGPHSEMVRLLDEAADRIEKDGAVLEDVKARLDDGWVSFRCPICDEPIPDHLDDCALAEAAEVER